MGYNMTIMIGKIMENNENMRLMLLKQMHDDVRSEIKNRIQQRDSFSIQFIVTIFSVLTISFLDFKFAPFLIFLIPLLDFFFSIQILYSYTIHDRCHNFLIEELEPEIGRILMYNEIEINKYFWEMYCEEESKRKALKAPGIRKKFFEMTIFIIPIVVSIVFSIVSYNKGLFNLKSAIIIASIILVIYELLSFTIYIKFNKNSKVALNKLAKCDYIDSKSKKSKNKRKVIFLDRDGTIHVDKVNTYKIEDLEYFDDTISSLKQLQSLGYDFVIVSNQDGIKKGLYDEKQMHLFNEKILDDMRRNNINVLAIYYSPFSKYDNNYSFKPNPGMLLRAKYELNISMKDSYFIGDQLSDVIAGLRSNVRPLLVKTGIYEGNLLESKLYNDIQPKTFESLSEISSYIKLIESNKYM